MKLREILSDQLSQAHRTRSVHRAADLGNGLHLVLYITPEGIIHLLMWRKQVKPAEHEWLTVMRHWPWPLPNPWPIPEEVKSAGGVNFGLRSAWHIKPQL